MRVPTLYENGNFGFTTLNRQVHVQRGMTIIRTFTNEQAVQIRNFIEEKTGKAVAIVEQGTSKFVQFSSELLYDISAQISGYNIKVG